MRQIARGRARFTRARSDGSLRADGHIGARMHLQIFDLDASLTGQASLGNAARWQSVRAFDFRDIGPKLRLWSRASTIEAARRRIAGTTGEPAVTLLGSGDFHHVAALLHERVRERTRVGRRAGWHVGVRRTHGG